MAQETQIQKDEERMVRIMSKDIEGRMKVYPGFTKIKGVSWSMANAICKMLKFDKNKKIGSLKEDEIKKIIKSSLSIAEKGMIINDLRRSVWALIGIKTLIYLFSKSTMVKNDAPLSVKRGFIK